MRGNSPVVIVAVGCAAVLCFAASAAIRARAEGEPKQSTYTPYYLGCPANTTLRVTLPEGELWGGRGSFETTSVIDG